jgi:hypothetical protein
MDAETFEKQIKKSYENWLSTKDTDHLKDIHHIVIDKEIADVMAQQQSNTMVRYQDRNIEILDTADIDGREGW